MEDEAIRAEESKKLLQEYGDAIIQLKTENERKKQNIRELKAEYKRIPKFIRNLFIKDSRCKKLIET